MVSRHFVTNAAASTTTTTSPMSGNTAKGLAEQRRTFGQATSTAGGYSAAIYVANFFLRTVMQYPSIDQLTGAHVEADNMQFLLLKFGNWLANTPIPHSSDRDHKTFAKSRQKSTTQNTLYMVLLTCNSIAHHVLPKIACRRWSKECSCYQATDHCKENKDSRSTEANIVSTRADGLLGGDNRERLSLSQ